jgi:hypothetical protein
LGRFLSVALVGGGRSSGLPVSCSLPMSLFEVLWLLASGFVALAIWRFIDRYRKHKN